MGEDHFDANERGLALDGEVTTATLGVDVERRRWLTGLVLSHSHGNGSFTPADDKDGGAGEVQSRLTGIWPYARLALNERFSVWSLLGYGEGTLRLEETGQAALRTDLSMKMGALGGRSIVSPAPEGGGIELALKADALWVRTASEREDGLERVETDTSRMRLRLDGSRAFELGSGTLVSSAEFGIRLDGGDAETGTGLEAGAGLSYTGGRVSVEGSVHGLLAHEASGYEEWGAGLSVKVEPGAHGRGLSLSLSPAWGGEVRGHERLWSASGSGNPVQDGSPLMRRRLDVEIGYGLAVARTPGVVKPYAGLGLAEEGERSLRAGVHWQITPGASLHLDGARRETRGGNAPEHELMLRAEMR